MPSSANVDHQSAPLTRDSMTPDALFLLICSSLCERGTSGALPPGVRMGRNEVFSRELCGPGDNLRLPAECCAGYIGLSPPSPGQHDQPAGSLPTQLGGKAGCRFW